MGGDISTVARRRRGDLDGGERFYDLETRSRDNGNDLDDAVRLHPREQALPAVVGRLLAILRAVVGEERVPAFGKT